MENALVRVELVRGGLVRSLIHKASGRYLSHLQYYPLFRVKIPPEIRGGALLTAHALCQCGPCSHNRVDAICGLSLLLVLPLAPGGFSLGTQAFPLLKNPSKFQFDQESSRRRTTKWMSNV